MSYRKTKCKFTGCPNEMHYMYLGVCKTCYSGLAYWRGRSQVDKRRREKQLIKLSSRMRSLITYPREVPHKRKK